MYNLPNDAHFLRETIVDIDAAVVGISRNRWAFVEAEATEAAALEKMRKDRFDVLPIQSNDFKIKSYFQTRTWGGYTSIVRRDITQKDVISFHTPIRDIIKGFATENRLFFFLVSDYNVVGLVSIANLNSRQVKVYLFSLLSELEVRLGELVSHHVDEDEIYSLVFGGDVKGKHLQVKEEYETVKATGVDVSIVEFLYLSDLKEVAAKKGLHTILHYSKTQFNNNLGSLIKLRDQVAHPTRSIISNVDDVTKLWRKVERAEEALFKLRQIG